MGRLAEGGDEVGREGGAAHARHGRQFLQAVRRLGLLQHGLDRLGQARVLQSGEPGRPFLLTLHQAAQHQDEALLHQRFGERPAAEPGVDQFVQQRPEGVAAGVAVGEAFDDRIVQPVEHAGAVAVGCADPAAGQQQTLTAVAHVAPDQTFGERCAAPIRGRDRHRLAAVRPAGGKCPPVAGRHHDDRRRCQRHRRGLADADGSLSGEHIVERQFVGRNHVEAPAAAHVAHLEGGDPHVEARQELFHRKHEGGLSVVLVSGATGKA